MKTRFSTLDICAALTEINHKALGLRLVNVYDIDHKTYLFKLAKPDLKMLLLIESGVRIHLSEFDWPKNNIPSGFAMKMRKHLRGRRLVSVSQLGGDRIVDLQFGSNEAAFHVFLELYDRGNIALTDHEDTILNLLRFRKTISTKEEQAKEENEDVKFAVHEPYPRHVARPVEPLISVERLQEILKDSKKDSLIKRVLTPHLPYGAACIDHCLSIAGFSGNAKLESDFMLDRDLEVLHNALKDAENYVEKARSEDSKGYIIQKREKKSDGELLTNVEFHPFLFEQHKKQPHRELPSFNQAVDEFYSSLESQKHDMKALQRERAAYRKLDNVRRDHENRLQALRSEQDEDKQKALIIESNLELVDQAIRVVCSAIANQVDWNEIKVLVSDAQARGDSVALAIKSLKLETNTMVMSLSEPVSDDDSDLSDESDDKDVKCNTNKPKPIKVDIDLSLTAYANAQNYYNKKRQAAQKEQRTVDASTKALKSAEKKTKQTLKEAAVISNIQKARKTYWFEKFLWFISSENYLVLGGRDAQQNELLVKKYLKPGDVYVHADLHGATSCIIKNNTGLPISPKTLNEAGTMAICHSAAWDAKVVTSAWWVYHDQVSKTAPSGEYLTTGSFMVRGRKNYLPPSYLIYGFGFLFKVDETCIWKHKGERKVRLVDDDLSSVTNTTGIMEELELHSDEEPESQDQPLNLQSTTDETEGAADSIASAPSVNPDSIDTTAAGKADDVDSDAEEDPKTQEIASLPSTTGVKTETTHTMFPDTQVKIHYYPPDKYQLDRHNDDQSDVEDNVVYLGDDVPVVVKREKQNDGSEKKGKPRLSAKQRREQKKLQKQQSSERSIEPAESETTLKEDKLSEKPSNTHQPAYVRGQKKKIAKMRRKNNFSDEEEDKKQMMEMLQSAKGKDKKKNKKENAVKQQKKASLKKEKQEDESQRSKTQTGDGTVKKERVHFEASKNDSDEERELALKEENLQLKEVDNALDSLTGIPAADDVILFAIPVCAPYNTMQSYKFKVKLTPGTGKKGKAAKTAISMFQTSRDINVQEKDHLRSVKDHDLSRNMPGKVKVSAPNLQRIKGKKR